MEKGNIFAVAKSYGITFTDPELDTLHKVLSDIPDRTRAIDCLKAYLQQTVVNYITYEMSKHETA